jgi:exonuclease SbcC
MRIRSVTAHMFGPLRGETLELADGMTVVVGDNESAKSSWHAAIYAAVCGRRRGRGRPREDEQRFIDLHKPWHHDDGWLITAEVVLDDGRRIELRHDLAGKVDCHAKDLDLGQDVSAEVMNDGAPDGARWLGLDRSSFAATACVKQAQLLHVLSQADGLQEYLQRAAATAGTDATAAAALDCIERFSRERVGTERANSAKPLRRAILEHDQAVRELDRRRASHEQYLSRLEQVEQLRNEATQAAAVVRAREAAIANSDADCAGELARRAGELYAIYGNQPPPSALDDDAIAQQVTAALTAWRSRPAVTLPPERTSEQLQQEIDALPAVPDGDIEPQSGVIEGMTRVERSQARLELHEMGRPAAEPETIPQVTVRDDELLDLARILEIPPSLIEREARASAAAPGHGWQVQLLIACGGALVLIGGLLAAVLAPALGAIALLGVAVAAAGLLRRRTADIQAPQQAGRSEVATTIRGHEQAVARCAQLGVDADPVALRALAVARSRVDAQQHDVQIWADQHTKLEAELREATAALASALCAGGNGVASGDPTAVLAVANEYQQTCRERAEQARRAARLSDLQRQLAAVRSVEARAVADEQRRTEAAQAVLAVARACDVSADTAEAAVPTLEEWLTQRSSHIAARSAAQQDWAELQTLLAGRSLADLQRTAEDASAKAARLTQLADPQLLSVVDAATAADELPALREAASRAESGAATAEGELRHFVGSVSSVAEAEEGLDEASARLDRVRELQETLQLTRKFLVDAQTRVHRNIAPVLAQTVKQWLPEVTGGRYTDAMVDPTSLRVQLCGPTRQWRPADRLSYGTAEQVYMLLRLALADQLTKGHDTCPLLLDDVTVHADAQRTRDILDLLLKVAGDRQVVVFTQEEQVAAWAHEHLTGPRHAIRKLAPVPVI